MGTLPYPSPGLDPHLLLHLQGGEINWQGEGIERERETETGRKTAGQGLNNTPCLFLCVGGVLHCSVPVCYPDRTAH